MSFESQPEKSVEQQEKEAAFESLLEKFEHTRDENKGYIRYELPYPKEEFLSFLGQKKNTLFHGSSERVDVLEPRQARDTAKSFGNKKAVYAVEDSVLPIFYAIQDRSKIHGKIISGKSVDEETGKAAYHFEMPKDVLESKPWKEGVVYVLNKDKFEQGRDEEGRPIDEWVVGEAIEPWARLEVAPEDFRFLDEIKAGK